MNAGRATAGARPQSAPSADEAALWLRFTAERSYAVREKLFLIHAPFARTLARRHFRDRRSGDIELPDLFQLAYAGLLEAIDRFSPGHGAPFRGYAARRISGSILDGIAKMSELREQVTYRNRVRHERAQSLMAAGAGSASAAEALQMLSDLAIGLALGFMLEGTGLYVGEDERQATSGANAYESLAWRDTLQQIGAEVSALPEREQTIIRRHYGDDLGFEQIGALLGLSKGRISQLHRAAIVLLKKRLLNSGAFRLER